MLAVPKAQITLLYGMIESNPEVIIGPFHVMQSQEFKAGKMERKHGNSERTLPREKTDKKGDVM